MQINVKFYLFCIAFSFSVFTTEFCAAQPGQWTWIHGSNATNSSGNFGTLGVPSPNNEPPSLYGSCTWTDLNGNFWLYGGMENITAGSSGSKNDLWKYDAAANEWTWMSGTNSFTDPGIYGSRGIPSPANRPPPRAAAASWVDQSGDLWWFGGFAGTDYSDLWKYNIASNMWTWMKGTASPAMPGHYGTCGVADTLNDPGARWECSTAWTDNAGDLWLFGGTNGNPLNDLWRYNIGANCWTWMKGSSTINQPGTYGTQGIEDSLNTPGARAAYAHWIDPAGNLWMFGGNDYYAQNNFNDLWRYNITTNNWTWMNGSNSPNSPGYYESKCVFSSSRMPAARFENRSAWTDSDGNFWMFGGFASPVASLNVLNDLWKYCYAANQWAWISGDSTVNGAGTWGSIGIANPSNVPEARTGSVSWIDQNNNLYLFGGCSQGWSTFYNDLWKYKIDTSCGTCNSTVILPTADFSLNINAVCAGGCINFTNLSLNANSYQWFFQGGNPPSDTSANPQAICYTASGNFDVSLIAYNANGADTFSLMNFVTVYPQVPFSPIVQIGDTLFSAAGYATYTWYFNSVLIPAANNYYYVAQADGNYSVVVTDSNGCFASAEMLNVIAVLNELNSSVNKFSANYNSGIIYLKINSSIESFATAELTDAVGKIIYSEKIFPEKRENIIIPVNISNGIYFLRVTNRNLTSTKKLIIGN